MRAGDWLSARSRCAELVERYPVTPEYQAYLGLCLLHSGELKEASDRFQKAFVLNPLYWEAGLKLAQCLDKLGRYEDALLAAKEGLKARPSEPTLLALARGLERQVPEKITDAYQLSMLPLYWMIDLKEPDDEDVAGGDSAAREDAAEDHQATTGERFRRPCADSP